MNSCSTKTLVAHLCPQRTKTLPRNNAREASPCRCLIPVGIKVAAMGKEELKATVNWRLLV